MGRYTLKKIFMEKNEKKSLFEELEGKSNNEILFEIKQMEADHEAIKLKMIKDYDKLIEIEKKFEQANLILLKRLKGE
jgi:SepF-like predicted cell division protein (DUF552 family)